MTEAELRARLRAIDPDTDPMAEQRAWQVVHAAYRPPVRRRARRRWRLTVPAVACLLALAAGTLAAARPPRETLVRWLREAIGLSAAPAPRPMLAGLPGGGQLLVNASAGPFVVHADGRRRYLGPYTAAAWSPHSLYVIAWRGSQLSALDPLGRLQWTLTSPGGVSVARWSPDGYRIAYVAARALWVVAGDGSGRRRLRTEVGPVAPAWQPRTGAAHRIAFVDRRGELRLLDADTGAQRFGVATGALPRQLLWSADGARLLVVWARQLTLYDPRGHRLATRVFPAGQTIVQAAFAPVADRVALGLHQAGPGGDSVALLDSTRGGLRAPAQILFRARERLTGIGWSPDAGWVLVSSSSADQWVFIGVRAPVRLQAVSSITGQFRAAGRPPGRFPSLGGWQDAARAQPGG